jgi:hypothetical protein
MSIAAHHADGARTAGITKPANTGVASLDALVSDTSLSKLELAAVLLAIDQEDKELLELWNEIEKRWQSSGFALRLLDQEGTRLRKYLCSKGGRRLEFIGVINGLEELKAEQHTVEDHLIKMTSDRGLARIANKKASKTVWQSLQDTSQDSVMKELAGKKDVFSNYFENQLRACMLLEQDITRQF